MTLLFRLSALLPLWFLHLMGAVLGWLVYALSPGYRRRFQENVALAGISARDARRAVGEAGKLVTEIPWVWLRPAHQKGSKITWIHGDLVESALSSGRGLIFMTPHIGCFEAAGQAHSITFSPRFGEMTVMYRPSRIGWFDALLRQARSAPGLSPAPTTLGGVRQIVKALRQGRVVGMLPDQVPADGMGVWAPFFGRPAYTMTLAARLARQTGAVLLVALCERLPWGRGYVIRVAPLSLPLDEGDEAAATALNAAMEELIRQQPAMYLWSYARYKQPRSEPLTKVH